MGLFLVQHLVFGPLLYMRVFVVAVSQAHAMRSHIVVVTLHHSNTKKAKKSDLKAAKILGIVVIVFLLCSSPYYCVTLGVNNLLWSSTGAFELWLLYYFILTTV